jgi:diacylglycerol kinase (ATP)
VNGASVTPDFEIILNPTSARGAVASLVPEIESGLQAHRLTYRLTLTEKPGHATALAFAACQRGCQVVVAAGGDGTTNEVANGILQAGQAGHSQPALGVLAVGQGNDFAYGAGIPPGVQAGVAILAVDERRWIDAGLVEAGSDHAARYFVNGVGIGFDAMVGFQAARFTRLQGFLAYAIAAIKTVFIDFVPPRVKIELDDEQSIERTCLMVSVMNGRRMGGGFHMTPASSMSDGRFSMCIAESIPRLQILAAIPKFLNGTQGQLPSISFAEARRVRVMALQGTLPAHADGETVSEAAQSINMQINPGVLQILAPTS